MANHVTFMGRLTREPEVRYGGANNTAIARYSIAVDRRFKQEGQPTADFFNLVSFGKAGEFVEKYLHKGTKIYVEAEARNNNYTNKDGQMVYSIEFVTNNIEFAESKNAASGGNTSAKAPIDQSEFMNVSADSLSELPFA